MRLSLRPFLVVAASVLVAAPATSAPPDTENVPSVLETVPTGVTGDTADDPAIWVNPVDPAASLVITNEKKVGRLTVYDLAGQVVQRITSPSGFYGNVDVRGDLVAASHTGIWTWRVTATANGPRLVLAREASGNASTAGEGLCLWDPGAPGTTNGLYAVNVHRPNFRVRVHPLTDTDGDGLLLVGKPVRDFYLGSEGEGCEVDDATGALYISEEDVGIWRYDLTAPTGLVPPRIPFASVGPLLAPDVEGLALAGGVLYASAQNVAAPRFNWYSRYDATSGAYLGSFRISDGTVSDDCDQTDGIDAYDGYLGPGFPDGLFVCQDGFNDAPGSSGTQNFKYASLDLVDGSP
jgi:myo-inositol-hexaphosphate 3-phosphohydrolase